MVKKETSMAHRSGFLVFVLVLFIAAPVSAHEGTSHVLGTVTASGADQLVVQAIDGQSVSIRLTPATRYRATGATTSSIPSVGDRVVVEVKGNSVGMTAIEVRLSSISLKKTRK